MTVRNLEFLFRPSSIAIVGSGREVEMHLARNLMNAGFGGPIMPVNPSHQALGGMLTYPDIASLPLVPDLALINSPLQLVPNLIDQLGERGTRAAAIIGDGLRVATPDERKALHQAILDAAKPHLLRVLGPDCLSLCVPDEALNASLTQYQPIAGHVALVIQSNAIAQTALDHGIRLGFGFSHLVSLGEAIDVDCADLLDYLANEYQVRAILLYLDRIEEPRKFMSAARRAARIKPVMVLKPRRSNGDGVDDAVCDAAFRRAGILRVNDQDEIFNLVEALTAVKPVANDRLAIVSNSYSLASLATDTLSALGGRLAQFSEATQTGLDSLLGTPDAVSNPIDLGDHALPERYAKTLDLLLKDRGIDGILVIKSPSALSQSLPVAEIVTKRLPVTRRCCMLASFPGPSAGETARQLTAKHRIPTYESATEAVRVFMHMVRYKRNQELLMETPPSAPEAFKPDTEIARGIIAQALADGRHKLNEFEALQLLAAYGVPVVESRLATSPQEAMAIAAKMATTVVLKIVSPDIAHKFDVGGVAIYLESPAAVGKAAEAMLARIRKIAPAAHVEGLLVQPMKQRGGAYEITLGIRSGGAFGPVIYFGQGGTEAHVIRDIAYGLPPLNMNLAREIMAQTRVYQVLRYSLLRRANLNALTLTLIKLSQMVIDLGEIAELGINTLWASPSGVMALDAHGRVAASESKPTYRLAIRPYPTELEEHFTLADGPTLLLRPILPEDEPALQALVRRTPQQDLMLRFFQPIRELPHAMGAQLTQIDYDRDMAVVIVGPGRPGKAEIHGLAGITADPDNERAEYSVIVEHSMKGCGLGSRMMRRIIRYARQRGIREVYGEVVRHNSGMLHLVRSLGFTVKRHPDEPGLMHVTLAL